MNTIHIPYLERCIQLASLGLGHVSPNPLVGAVLVYEGRIIGEGYHAYFGGKHAEVNCIESVKQGDEELINKATLYVSLEPCAHHGKTPPCVDFILKHKIPKVVIGQKDIFHKVNGQGIKTLENNGVEVILSNDDKPFVELNKRFITNQLASRPYLILKWAQTADGFIGIQNKKVQISNTYSISLVHKWRHEEDAIWVGYNTVSTDNPQLTTRYWKGKNPTRIVYDADLSLAASSHIFDSQAKTLRFHSVNKQRDDFYLDESNLLHSILHKLFVEHNIGSVLVEGGTKLLQEFIRLNLFDELRVIQSTEKLHKGMIAPLMPNNLVKTKEFRLSTDCITIYKPTAQ